MTSKHRLEALSDGVFAIVMTLLVVGLDFFGFLGAEVLADLRRPCARTVIRWISFAITFAIAAVFWNLQRRVFAPVSDVTDVNIFLTFLTLAFVTMLPFTTSLWGHHLNERLAFFLYFANQFVIGAVLTAKLEIARGKGHVKTGPEFNYMRFRLYTVCAVMASASLASLYLPLQ